MIGSTKRLKIRRFFLMAVALLLSPVRTHAADIEPRAYTNAPTGINFLIAGYGYSDGGLATAGSSPIQKAKLQMHTGVLAYVRTLDILGKSGKVDLILPYSDLSGHAMVAGQRRERHVSGWHDPLCRVSVNLYGAPALSMKEFVDYRQNLILGVSLQVALPAGQYDHDRLVNLGNNRWFVKPDIGLSKAWGPLALEVTSGVTFFSDNDDYLGGKTLEQDPVYTGQVHAIYTFNRALWMALGGVYEYGGRTSVDGTRNDDREENSRAGVTLSLAVNRRNSVKLHASTSVATSRGRDYDLGGVVWQYRWGEGL